MTRLVWNDILENHYEAGVSNGVFYPKDGSTPEAWNGIVSVTDAPKKKQSTTYVDGLKRRESVAYGAFSATIKGYIFPDAFYEDELSRTKRRYFDFSYRTQTDESDKIHLVYNALASSNDYGYVQRDSDPFEWSISTTPIDIPSYGKSSHLVVDLNQAHPDAVAALEDVLYGTASTDPRMPGPIEVLELFEGWATLVLVLNGDGTATISDSGEAISESDGTTFRVTWPSVVYVDTYVYRISSF